MTLPIRFVVVHSIQTLRKEVEAAGGVVSDPPPGRGDAMAELVGYPWGAVRVYADERIEPGHLVRVHGDRTVEEVIAWYLSEREAELETVN